MRKVINIHYIGVLIIIIINIPFLLSNGNMFIGESWDFLDSNVCWLKLLAENNNYLFVNNNYTISQFMDVPRIALGSEFDLLVYFTKILGSYKAFALNILLQQLIAFIGIYKLNNLFFNKTIKENILNILISFSFAMLIFWEANGIGLAGFPYLLYVVIVTMDRKPQWYEWTFIFIYPFYSSFFVSTIFVLFFIITVLFYFKIFKKKNIKYPIIFIATLCLLGVFVNYRFFIEVINPSFISHREEFIYSLLDFKGAVRRGRISFLLGEAESPSLHNYIILPFVILSMLYMLLLRKYDIKSVMLFIGILFIAFLVSFTRYQPIVEFKSNIPLLGGFQIDRFYLYYPVLWYVLFVVVINNLLEVNYNKTPIRKFINTNFNKSKCLILNKIQILFSKFFTPKFQNNLVFIIIIVVVILNLRFVLLNSVTYRGLKDAFIYDKKELVTFNEFYASKELKKIKKIVSDSKMFSLGIHPAVAACNGLNTIDGYSGYYRLNYKHKFGKIMQKELDQNLSNKKYFENWGSRCYIFDDELGRDFDYTKLSKQIKVNLELNYDILRELNCNYFISTVEVVENRSIKLIYNSSDKIRNYFLYKIKVN